MTSKELESRIKKDRCAQALPSQVAESVVQVIIFEIVNCDWVKIKLMSLKLSKGHQTIQAGYREGKKIPLVGASVRRSTHRADAGLMSILSIPP